MQSRFINIFLALEQQAGSKTWYIYETITLICFDRFRPPSHPRPKCILSQILQTPSSFVCSGSRNVWPRSLTRTRRTLCRPCPSAVASVRRTSHQLGSGTRDQEVIIKKRILGICVTDAFWSPLRLRSVFLLSACLQEKKLKSFVRTVWQQMWRRLSRQNTQIAWKPPSSKLSNKSKS